MKNKSKFSRRDFITKSATGFAALTIIPRFVLGGRGYIAPSDKVNAAVIGCGNQGKAGKSILSAVYIGDKGIMMHDTHGAKPVLVGNDGFKGVNPWLPRTKNIFEDWINAIKNGKKSCNDFAEVSGKLTEIMLLGNIAVRTKSKNTDLKYDAKDMKITNLPEANNYFHYEYREGWKL